MFLSMVLLSKRGRRISKFVQHLLWVHYTGRRLIIFRSNAFSLLVYYMFLFFVFDLGFDRAPTLLAIL
ncbi:hypothetical protein P154DRAFT_14464 [Amniculicola lignicola CBS 123094]|uniref:Uncharacterized protein n=1 Tax=Amniculicola lignicola CBS 123094 TaxID=1392246 RepID=A0A6A5X508_9PLEO|nr:hypothetical protein P154DRAFT_14464 [Amniculicola lignicola CBS 123094]